MHDPRLIRFAEVLRSTHELGTKDVCYVLRCSRAVVQRLCTTGQIEASWATVNDRVEAENQRLIEKWKREGREGTPPLKKRRRGQQRSWTVTAPALLSHLITHTHPRTLLMAGIRELLPAWESFAQRIASGATLAEAQTQQQAARSRSAKHAPNVLLFDPACDLFPQVTPAATSAA